MMIIRRAHRRVRPQASCFQSTVCSLQPAGLLFQGSLILRDRPGLWNWGTCGGPNRCRDPLELSKLPSEAPFNSSCASFLQKKRFLEHRISFFHSISLMKLNFHRISQKKRQKRCRCIMKNHQEPYKNQGFLRFLQISALYIFGTPEPSLGHDFASKLAPWTHFGDPETPSGRPVGSQGASWEVLGVVSGRLFLPLSELWITLMHPWGSFDDTEHPFLSILGSLGAIFLHFGTHFGYFCMCKKVK